MSRTGSSVPRYRDVFIFFIPTLYQSTGSFDNTNIHIYVYIYIYIYIYIYTIIWIIYYKCRFFNGILQPFHTKDEIKFNICYLFIHLMHRYYWIGKATFSRAVSVFFHSPTLWFFVFSLVIELCSYLTQASFLFES